MRWRKRVSLVLAVAVVGVSLSAPYRAVVELANPYWINRGDTMRIMDLGTWVRPGGVEAAARADGSWDVGPARSGERVVLSLLGRMPIKVLEVHAVASRWVVPSGHSIGIQLRMRGAVVVGGGGFETPRGWRDPGAEAGLMVGDRIVRLDGVALGADAGRRVAVAVRRGRALRLRVLRGGRTLTVRVRPAADLACGCYRIGLMLRDGVTGVGTLTFIDPRRGRFMALGHAVEDAAHRPMALSGGQVLLAGVVGILRARRGTAGAKLAAVDPLARPWGVVTANRPEGIEGRLASWPRGPLVEVATPDEVHVGPAVMLTALCGQRVEAFRIRIDASDPQQRATGHGLVIRVTDERLVRRTGGIVQGMSGSPILQDGRIVGAVTHVWVNRPLLGYATFAQWMLPTRA